MEPENNDESVSGSVKITLKAAVLESLSEGEHVLKAVFDDGSVETKLAISKAAVKPSTPDTSDHSHTMIWLSVLAVSVCTVLAALRRRMHA